MDVNDFFVWYGEHVIGVVIVQILFGGEWKLGKVGQGFKIFWVDVGGVEFGFVVWYIVVNVVQCLFQMCGLECDDFIVVGSFYGV